MPTMIQAGVYAAVLHYLKALARLKGDEDGRAIVAAMKAMPTDDPLFGKGRIRERPQASSHVSLRGEVAVRVEISLGLLQAAADDSGRGGVRADRAERVPAAHCAEVKFEDDAGHRKWEHE
jgi:branched-chain amino acid transport system substrate-binding protein